MSSRAATQSWRAAAKASLFAKAACTATSRLDAIAGAAIGAMNAHIAATLASNNLFCFMCMWLLLGAAKNNKRCRLEYEFGLGLEFFK